MPTRLRAGGCLCCAPHGAPGTDLRKTKMSFDSLGLHAALTQAVTDAGYGAATDVQARAIPPAMQGHDLMVSSSTGSGKTASFILPALQRILAARGDNTKRRD